MLSKIEMLEEALGYLEHYKKKGTISHYEIVKSLESVPADAYILLYDTSYTVCAVLGPESSSERKNVATGQTDSRKNYGKVGAYWFR